MHTPLIDLDPGPCCPELLRMVVEIPENSWSKCGYDAAPGVFRLNRAPYSPINYPGVYGFIPEAIT